MRAPIISGPTTEPDHQPGGYRWYVLGLLTLTSAISVADRLVFGILVEDIKAEFQLSDFQLGLLGGLAFSLVYVVAGFPAARLADRSVRKNIVAGAIGFWSLMTAACGPATGFWTLFLARTGVGVGEGCSGPSSQSLVADFFARHELAKAMGFLTVGASMGTAGGLIIGGQLAELFDWRDSGMDGEPVTGSLCAAPVAEVAEVIASLIDDVRPTVVVTLDASDGHRDHVHIRDATLEAARSSAWEPAAVYLHCLPQLLMRKWVEALRREHPDSEHLGLGDLGTPEEEITTVIDTADLLELRQRAIAASDSRWS